jgi:S-DNA-T family DNA segregation ATPase FtsK/SpoIIIE
VSTITADRVEERAETLLGQRGREIRALLLVGACLYALLAIGTFTEAPVTPPGESAAIPREGLENAGGSFGYVISAGMLYVFGIAAYLPCLFVLLFGVIRLLGHQVGRLILKALGVVVLTALVATLVSPTQSATATEWPWGIGGKFGYNMSPKLFSAFGGSGRILILVFGVIIAFLLATEWAFSALVLRGYRSAARGVAKVRAFRSADDEDDEEEEEEDEDEDEEEEDEDEDEDDEEEDEEDEAPVPKKKRAAAGKKAKGRASGLPETSKAPQPGKVEGDTVPTAAVPVRPKPKRRTPVKINRPKKVVTNHPSLPFDAVYPFPPIDLFQEPPPPDGVLSEEQVRKNAAAIERRLAAFKIESSVVGVSPGPAVTQYELRLAEGIKVSKIVSFEADLAGALKAVSVRVVAPIPGRDTVGIEVPNDSRQIVVLRELLESGVSTESFAIPLYLGRDVAGDPIIQDLAKMPHVLIAGTTGSGKSVCINTILLSILMTRTPNQVRLILIDPKMVELQIYAKVPHLACPVVTNMKKAPGVLNWAVEEMEKRYSMLSAARTNHISSYNKLGQEELSKRLGRSVPHGDVEIPYIVLVIDELADLMGVAAKDVEEYIQRLAQKSRAVGIHVILATQRPSTDVVTGVIKANLPCTIGFQVNRKVDSRVILDSNGAEKLLGHGDMLYIGPSSHSAQRAQGAFVSEEEIHRVVGYLESEGAQQAFIPDLVQTQTATRRKAKERDELYEQAVEIILGQQRGSATLLQRALSVGYTRATRLLELMEQDGLVGSHNGSKSREVYLTLEEWQVQEEAIAEELASSEGDEDLSDEDLDQGEFDGSVTAEHDDSDEALANPATEEIVDDRDSP